MRREEERPVEEEPRGLSDAGGRDRRAAEPAGENRQDGWTDAGTEDPAFFIKPADRE